MTRPLTLAALLFAALAPGDDKLPPPPKPPAFKAPKGWKEEKAGLVASARFRVGEGDKAARVTVTSLRKDGGGIAANVNRWRDEVGLARLKDEDALKAVRAVKVGGLKGHSFDVTGEGTGDKPAQRTIVAFVRRDEVTWFFKLSGPAAPVKEQKAAFEQFLKSVRFGDPKKE
jgi:hypothetical protein